MKTKLLNALLVLCSFWLTGCIVVVREEHKHPPKEPPHIGCEPVEGMIEEIDAAGNLSFEPAKRDAYQRLARRPGLSDEAQQRLVAAVFDTLAFEPFKRDVLIDLIKNPCFAPGARKAILSQIDRISFEPTKSEILQAISQR